MNPPDDLPVDTTYFETLRKWMEETLGIQASSEMPENDWMLIIKLHAMIEAALNSALSRQFGVPALEKVIARLDTSDGSRGKAAFAKALGVLDNPSIKFLQKLSELRNSCVHNIRNFQFDLTKHLAEIDEDDRKALLNAIIRAIPPNDTILVSGVPVTAEQIVTQNPKFGLFGATMNVMVQLHLHHKKCSLREMEHDLHRTKSKLLDAQDRPNPKAR